jgi:hypothetical protein
VTQAGRLLAPQPTGFGVGISIMVYAYIIQKKG